MGCDIHIAVEVQRDNGTWRFVQPPERVDLVPYSKTDSDFRTREWYPGRNYTLFSILADVRNTPRTDYRDNTRLRTPIKMPVGYPIGMSPESCEFFDADSQGSKTGDNWHHSATWYLLSELKAVNWNAICGTEKGCINAKQYAEYRLTGKTPDSYSGGCGGPDIVTISNEEMDDWLLKIDPDDNEARLSRFTVLEWGVTYEMCSDYSFRHLLCELDCGRFNDRVRIIMDFDN